MLTCFKARHWHVGQILSRQPKLAGSFEGNDLQRPLAGPRSARSRSVVRSTWTKSGTFFWSLYLTARYLALREVPSLTSGLVWWRDLVQFNDTVQYLVQGDLGWPFFPKTRGKLQVGPYVEARRRLGTFTVTQGKLKYLNSSRLLASPRHTPESHSGFLPLSHDETLYVHTVQEDLETYKDYGVYVVTSTFLWSTWSWFSRAVAKEGERMVWMLIINSVTSTLRARGCMEPFPPSACEPYAGQWCIYLHLIHALRIVRYSTPHTHQVDSRAQVLSASLRPRIIFGDELVFSRAWCSLIFFRTSFIPVIISIIIDPFLASIIQSLWLLLLLLLSVKRKTIIKKKNSLVYTHPLADHIARILTHITNRKFLQS